MLLSRLKSCLPTAQALRDHKLLRCFQRWLHDPWLWHFRRRSVARAWAVGVFCAMLPLPVQTYIAILLAIFVRANLPLVMALVWITNPVTIPPIFYVSYLLGLQIVGTNGREVGEITLNWEWFVEKAAEIYWPLWVGTQVIGISLALLSYFGVHWVWKRGIRRKRRLRVALHNASKETAIADSPEGTRTRENR